MQDVIKKANKRSDYVVFWLNIVLCFAIIGVILMISHYISTETSQFIDATIADAAASEFYINALDLAIIGVIFLVLSLVMIRMMRQSLLGNALQVEYSDYAWLRDWSNQVAKDLEMPRVEIMVTQDPVMNAYAFGFMKPYNIVLNSGLVRYASRDELKAIVVHEMAHIKYRHTQMTTYSNVLRIVPFAGALFGWMLDFWGRRAEFTADRLALMYLRDKNIVKRALICVHVGPDVAKSFNDLAQQWQVYQTDSPFNKFSQSFSSHPFLVRRLQRIEATKLDEEVKDGAN